MKAVEISNNEWNYLKDDGTYLLDEHVYKCYNFSNGFGLVQYNDNTDNFVNLDCKTLLKTNVNECYSFYGGFAEVRINDIWYLIDKNCNFYNNKRVSFKELYELYPNMRSLLIEIIDKYTYHDTNEYFYMKAVEISLLKYNYLKDDGSYLLDEHVKFCYGFSEGFGIVKYYNGAENFVNSEGKTLLKNNVVWCYSFDNGFALIRINKIYYYIDKECNFFTEDNISFKQLYKEFPNKRSELIEIISTYTYHNTNDYFI